MSMTIIGGIAAVGGAGTALYGAASASSAAGAATKGARRTAKAQLDFEKEKYQEWQDTYGGLEDNLAKYYDELTPTLRTMQGLESFEKEKNLALTDLRENLAQRGIATSGISAQLETEVALDSATARAKIRADAPMEVAREKLSFLQVGLGQDPSGGISDALAQNTRTANNLNIQTANAASGAIPNAIGATVNAAEHLYNAFKPQPTKTTTAGSV